MCKEISTINCDVLDHANINDFIFNGIDKETLQKIVFDYNFHGFDKYL
jgi:hypothetical protein